MIASSTCATPGLTTLTARIDVMDIQVTYRTPKVLSPAYWEEVIQRSPAVGENGEALKSKYNNVTPDKAPTAHDALALAARCIRVFLLTVRTRRLLFLRLRRMSMVCWNPRFRSKF